MTSDANKALLRRWHDEMNAHNVDACDTMLADDYSEHNNMVPEPLDKPAAKRLMADLFAALPDARREIIEQVAEGDRVVERLRYSGTQSGPFMGIPATGRTATFEAVMISRIRGEQIAEIWALLDAMSLMQQLGVIPTPAAAE